MGNQESKGHKKDKNLRGNMDNNYHNTNYNNNGNSNLNQNNNQTQNNINDNISKNSSTNSNDSNGNQYNIKNNISNISYNNQIQNDNNQNINSNMNNQNHLSQTVLVQQPSNNNSSNSPNSSSIKDQSNYSNNNINLNNQQQVKQTDPVFDYLNRAYTNLNEGNVLFKQFSFYEALFKFEEAQKIVTTVYPQIKDEQLKLKVDMFLKTCASQVDLTNYQIKNQFEYKKTAGFASKADEKQNVDYLSSLRKKPNYNDDNYKLVDTNNKNNSNSTNTTNNNQNNSNQNSNQTNNNTNANDTKNDKNLTITSDLRTKILSEIVDNKPNVKFTDVIGLAQAKQILKEIIVLPNLRPDLFTGLRSPPRGLLLFGPPGVGKTLIAKAVATECACTFFNISASALTSKYLGESEKLVRALFELAYEKQPSVIFIDEIESILSKRTDNENEASKRLKTEFLIQFDGVGSNQQARVLIIGATNRPFDLDTAVLRRLPKRIYIGAFEKRERMAFIFELLRNNPYNINETEFDFIGNFTENYSNSDLRELCREAAYEPIREITDFNNLTNVSNLRPTIYSDFLKASKVVRGTLNETMLKELMDWNSQYGAIG